MNKNGMIQRFPHIYKSKETIFLFLFLKAIFEEVIFVARVVYQVTKTTYHTIDV